MAERLTGAQFAALLVQKSKREKYGNKRTPDPDGGKPFDSIAEFKYAQMLKIEQRAGRVVSWERQVRLPIAPEGVTLCTYVADFVVLLSDGRRRVVECKGLWTDYALLKAKAFRLYWLPKHPDHDYVVTGAQARRPNKRRKS